MAKTKRIAPETIRTRITGMQFLKGSDLQDHSGNWRFHPQHQREALAGILREVGIAGALLVYDSEKHGGLTVIDGHLRKGDFPEQEWPCLMTDLTDAEADYMLLVHDPLAAQADAEKSMVEALMQRVHSGEVGVQALLAQMAENLGIVLVEAHGTYPLGEVPEPEIDRAEELRQQWGTEVGQLWALGRHRVLCGDCTRAEDVTRLMSGKYVALVITDPPYGVSYADKNVFLNTIGRANHIESPIANDHLDRGSMQTLWKAAFSTMAAIMAAGAVVYCFMPQGGDQMMMMMMMESAGIEPRHELIWVKNNHVLGRVDYAYKHEPILYAWKAGGHKYYGGFQTSLLEFPKPQKSDLHPTTKPVALVARLMENSSLPDDMVYDGFLGSGTTLMASEQLRRQCYGMEITPAYVAVTLQRWADMTGGTPQQVEG